MSEVAEAEKRVFIRCEFREEPRRLSVGSEELYHRLVIGFGSLGDIGIAAKVGFEFACKQHC